MTEEPTSQLAALIRLLTREGHITPAGRRQLERALTGHETEIRTRIARDIEAVIQPAFPDDPDICRAERIGLQDAARIARGTGQ